MCCKCHNRSGAKNLFLQLSKHKNGPRADTTSPSKASRRTGSICSGPHEFRPIAEWCKDEQHRRCWHHHGQRHVHERHDRRACSVAKPYCSTFTPSPTTPARAGREHHVLTEMDPASVGNKTRVARDGVRLRLLVKTTLERHLQPR